MIFFLFCLAELALEVYYKLLQLFDSFNIFSADNVKMTELSFRDDVILALGPASGWEWIITRACHDTWWHLNFFLWQTWRHVFMQLE